MSVVRRRAALVLGALLLGGACGAGVAFGLYPAWFGIGAAVVVAACLAAGLVRLRATHRVRR